MTPFPTLVTDRLRLRAFRLSDAPEIQRLAGAIEIARFTTLPHPYEDGMAEAWIRQQRDDYEAGRLVNFAIDRHDDDRLIGSMGLTLQMEHRRAELGYWIGVPYWNMGYCTEAAREVIAFGFERLKLHRIYAIHYGRNVASGRVLQKLGMQYEGTQRQHHRRFGIWDDGALYGLLRSEYEAR